jgi:hypothetical protein
VVAKSHLVTKSPVCANKFPAKNKVKRNASIVLLHFKIEDLKKVAYPDADFSFVLNCENLFSIFDKFGWCKNSIKHSF